MARKATYDSTIVKKVRNQVLGDIYDVLKETKRAQAFGAFKREMLLRLSTTVLPRVNEVSGIDGSPIQIQGVEIKVRE